jgi:MFS family permease
MVDTEVLLALMPVSILKALVGFTTFLFAFDLRREGAATWWFGFVLGAFTAGALIGVLLVARIRRVLTEQQMLTASLWLVAGVTGLGALYTARWFWAVVALVVGLAMAVAKPSFDALVQRHVRESDQGRAFARNETRFQIMWVAGSFVPVVLSLPAAAGNLVMALVAATGALSYMSSRRGRRTRIAST